MLFDPRQPVSIRVDLTSPLSFLLAKRRRDAEAIGTVALCSVHYHLGIRIREDQDWPKKWAAPKRCQRRKLEQETAADLDDALAAPAAGDLAIGAAAY